MQKGRASLQFEHPVYIEASACIAGKKEGDGPLGDAFDMIEEDPMCGMETWEEAESALQQRTAELVLKKAGLRNSSVRYLFAGDLLGQLIATSFGLMNLQIPMFGLYGACSTMGEALELGAMCVDAGHADRVIALASSHYATAEKQFRFPLGYGNQRPQAAAWTVTGCGAVILSSQAEPDPDFPAEAKTEPETVSVRPSRTGELPQTGTRTDRTIRSVRISGVTAGVITDLGVKDTMNMGAAMAPAAWNTIMQNLRDFHVEPDFYDQIITGDLGETGSRILLDFMKNEGLSIDDRHMDCGLKIYSNEAQDTHAGGSGCGCSAVVLCAHVLPHLMDGTWKRVLFLPTGALLSTVSSNEGQSIPGIAHAIVLEGGTL